MYVCVCAWVYILFVLNGKFQIYLMNMNICRENIIEENKFENFLKMFTLFFIVALFPKKSIIFLIIFEFPLFS